MESAAARCRAAHEKKGGTPWTTAPPRNISTSPTPRPCASARTSSPHCAAGALGSVPMPRRSASPSRGEASAAPRSASACSRPCRASSCSGASTISRRSRAGATSVPASAGCSPGATFGTWRTPRRPCSGRRHPKAPRFREIAPPRRRSFAGCGTTADTCRRAVPTICCWASGSCCAIGSPSRWFWPAWFWSFSSRPSSCGRRQRCCSRPPWAV
jgi:hypothetical protein